MSSRFGTAQSKQFWLWFYVSIFFVLLLGLLRILRSDPIFSSDVSEIPSLSISNVQCDELIAQGGFEMGFLGWELLSPNLPFEYKPTYVISPTFSGSMAVRLGLVDKLNSVVTNGVSQTLHLPNSANTIALTFHYLSVHDGEPDGDLQFVDIIDASTEQKIARLWGHLAIDQSWSATQLNLTPLRGKIIRVEFGVYNDGRNGHTALYLDEISVMSCGIAPKLVLTSTETATSFTTTISQQISVTALPALITSLPSLPTAYILPIPPLPTEYYPESSSIQLPLPNIVIAQVFVATESGLNESSYVVLLNLSNTQRMDGWTISDDAGNIFVFRNYTFTSMSALKIHSGNGHDTQTEIFWGERDLIRNDTSEGKIFLKDATGTLVDTFTIVAPDQ